MADRSGTALVERIAEGDLEPTGVVTVEIRNERGKVIDREVKSNFIAKTWKAHARAMMRLRWMQFGYNKQFIGQAAANTLDQNWPYSFGTVPIFPADMMACWNQTTAEDSVNEHTPNVPATGLIAWASRFPFSTPIGARGNVSTPDSFVNDDTVRHVFDWASSQGNGTFRSVGWLRSGAPGIHLLSAGTQQRTVTNITWVASLIIGGTTLFPGVPYVDPVSGVTYLLMRRQTGSNVHRVVSYVGATALSSVGLSITGSRAQDTQAVTNVSGEFIPASAVNNTSTFLSCAAVLGRVAGATVFSTDASSGVAGPQRWGVVNDAGVVSTSYAFPNQGWIVGCVIGTTLYAGSNGGTAPSDILTLNTSTGATLSTIPISATVTALCTLAGITTPRAHRMTTDGTDLFVLYGQASSSVAGNWLLVRLDTAGALQQIIGIVPHVQSSSQQTETSGVPYAGTYGYNKAWWNVVLDYGGLSVDATGGGVTTEDIFTALSTNLGDLAAGLQPGWGEAAGAYYGASLAYYDGSLFFGAFNSSVGQATTIKHLWMRQGFDLGSRVLLAASRTKSPGQTMRIIYDITLPGWL